MGMNIYQIAEEAGVSIATVSRVLNNSGTVSIATKERVMRIIEKHQYRPNVFARGLMVDSMKTVGVICADVSDVYIAKLLSLLQAQLNQKNYDTLLFCVGSHQETTLKHLRYLQSKHLDAIFLVGSSFSDTVDRNQLEEITKSVPIIMINGQVDVPGVYSVLCDDTESIRKLTLLLLGQNITCPILMYDRLTPSAKRKVDGFRKAISSENIHLCERQIICCHQDSLDAGYEAMMNQLKSHQTPDAVIATSDTMAIGALRALREQNINIPVVGFDNTLLCQCVSPPLPSIDPNAEQICSMAVSILDELTKGAHPKPLQICPAELVLRDALNGKDCV